MKKYTGPSIYLNVLRCCLIGLLLPLAVMAQPRPIVKGEENVQIEIRLKSGTTTGRLSKLPSAGSSIPNLSARWLWYSEPCWKTATDCVVTSITVKTFYKIPVTGTRYNWTGWWCSTVNGECVMPAFPAVSVPPGQKLCMNYDRHLATWKVAPRVCLPEDLIVAPLPTGPPIPISADGTWFTIESLSGVILSAHGSWTFGALNATGNREILLNGAASGIDGVRLEMIAGKVHTTNKAGVLSQWSGTAWVQISAPPVAVKSPPGDCISAVAAPPYPCNRLVTKIITADLAEWTFTWLPPAKAFRNGIDTKLPYLDATMIYMSNSGYIKSFSPSHLSNNSGYICWNNVVWGTGC